MVLDIEALIQDVLRIQRQAKQLGIDLKTDFSLTTERLAQALLWIAKNAGWDPPFRKVPTEVRDDCVSRAVLYMLKYGIKNFDPEKSHDHFIPYFRRIAHSAYYRTLQNYSNMKIHELQVKRHILETNAHIIEAEEFDDDEE